MAPEIDIAAEIRLINQTLEYLKRFIEEDRKKYDDHVATSDDFREKVTKHDEQIAGIKSELTLLKWMLGIIITVGLALLGKLFQIF